MRRTAIASGLIVAVAAGLSLAAQDQRPPFRIDANYVRIDVYPTRAGMIVPDLTAEDFEVTEDKVPQKIEQFERVVIAAAGGGAGRREPNTIAESREAIQDPRARVFVLFLDPKHVDLGASRQIGPSLVKALNRLIGPDDYVGVMRPGMSARDVTFARRTTSIESVLTNDWWGERDQPVLSTKDSTEQTYAMCYPGVPEPGQTTASDQGIAQEMILRRREQQTLDALEDLSMSLRGIREERKAVLAITNGWLLYRPNASLARPLEKGSPPIPVAGVDPRSGRVSPRISTAATADYRTCERDREALAAVDDEQRLRTIMDEANRSNVAFYPLDPRGLVAFDEDIVPAAGVGFGVNANPTLTPEQDSARLTARSDSLRRLADGTDGIALVATSQIGDGLERIAGDLSAYYLLGYYSTGKVDGKFHTISVRVKRSGVSVRARRGYLALRPEDLRRSVSSVSAAATSPETALAVAAFLAVAKLEPGERELPFRMSVTAGWHPRTGGGEGAVFWTIGEVRDRGPGRDLEAILTTSGGEVVSSARGQVAPGLTSTMMAVMPDGNIEPGNYVIRVRTRGPNGSEELAVPVTLPPASQSSGAVFVRRGPNTGNKDAPTADLRFRRNEHLRVEVPTAANVTGAHLRDRNGSLLQMPVAFGTRSDADGTRWATADVSLAPLSQGTYMVEVDAGEAHTLAAFRLVN